MVVVMVVLVASDDAEVEKEKLLRKVEVHKWVHMVIELAENDGTNDDEDNDEDDEKVSTGRYINYTSGPGGTLHEEETNGT
ncbi:hypothetical protein M0802_001264 [Mischocyttarus mexicanus]|nr:hypothetical protein M0802_001264 [Mischocyttarus mexicanus]